MARKPASSPTPLAYSYIRFSHPDQAKGDSLRRQTEAAAAWCKRNGVRLDSSTTLRDLGRSAYTGAHRQNPDRHALAGFLQLVERGNVPRGSYLIVENLDRLSREDIQPALLLALNLLQSGVRLVQLKPAEIVFDDKSDTMPVMMMMMELSRGHSESAMKSERVGKAWAQKKQQAAENGEPVTKRTPSWLRVEGSRFDVDKEKAVTIRRIYRMAIEGLGIGAITRRLNSEGVPPIGKADYWARSYVAKLLGNRAAFGEYQPFTGRGGSRKPDGAAIPGYYPPVISEDEFHAAQAAMKSRKLKGGRPSPRLNLFTGLLRDARTGGGINQMNKASRDRGGYVLVPYLPMNGVRGGKAVSFPAEPFEEAVLELLREIDPRDVLPKRDDATDRVLSLTGKHAELETRIEKVKAELMAGDDLAPLVDVLRSLEGKRKAAAEQLAEAKQEAASPVSEGWGEYRSLLDALAAAPDPAEARLRLRAALRRIVESCWCLFLGRGTIRVAAVQMYFKGDGHRDYLIAYKPATGGSVGVRPAKWWARSFAAPALPAGLDLRKREHARRLEKALTNIELTDEGG